MLSALAGNLLYLFLLITYSYLLAYSCTYTYPYAHTLFLAETLHTYTTATMLLLVHSMTYETSLCLEPYTEQIDDAYQCVALNY